MVGLLEDVERHVRMPFHSAGDVVALLGTSRDELGGSEFLRTIRGRDDGPCPEVDLEAESRLVRLLVALARERELRSAHDVSDGGFVVALAECAMKSGLGAVVSLDSDVRPSSLLFGETTGRALVTFEPGNEAAVRAEAERGGVPFAVVGRVGGDRLAISVGGRNVIDEPVSDLRTLWSTAFARALESADVL
jgi:phosphoribosylformylglycinamidine synthase